MIELVAYLWGESWNLWSKPSTDTIRARFNYSVDTGVPPVRYIDGPEMEHKAVPPQYREYEMVVRNGRPLRDTFALDTHGFVFADHHTQVKDFTDADECKRVYDPEVAALIKKHSGASDVVVFDHTIRIGDEQLQKASGARPPVKGVHNDYTEASAPRRLREIVGDAEAERRLQKRWAIVQVWRPIRGTVLVDPLGICDGRSIPQKGFIRVERATSTARVRCTTLPTIRRMCGSTFRGWSGTRRSCSRCSTPTPPSPRVLRRTPLSMTPTHRRTHRRAKVSRPARLRFSTSRLRRRAPLQ
jgi:hypothetical protein